MATGAELIAAERQRQIEVEGWDEEHDRGHALEIALAGASYAIDVALPNPDEATSNVIGTLWPWDEKWWKPTPGDRIRQLTKAGALIAAAIDSMQAEGYVTQLPGQTDMGLG